MPLSVKPDSSEAKYLQILEEYFNEIWHTTCLPSHGIDHHKRVWRYAKEILAELIKFGYSTDETLRDKLIIASLLHDLGMIRDTGPGHGAESRRLCESFLRKNNLSAAYFHEVLEAIEKHDNKEYLTIDRPENLLTILSVADDLDAFGFIGIYRYLEIYLKRNIASNELGELVLTDCERRFRHFLSTCGFSGFLAGKHSERYEIINRFFISYNNEIPSWNCSGQAPSGYHGIAEIIRENIETGMFVPTIERILKYNPDPVVNWFFHELKVESEQI